MTTAKEVKILCIKTVTIGAVGIAYLEGNEYMMPAKQAKDYAEYFELVKVKQAAKPKNKAKKTEENK